MLIVAAAFSMLALAIAVMVVTETGIGRMAWYRWE